MMLSGEATEDDTVLAKFLAFLAADIDANPERLNAMDPFLQSHLQTLTSGIEVDLDQPLDE